MVTILYKWLFVASLVCGVHTTHPVFISVTEIEHNAKDKTLEISCKIFTDDFEKALRKEYKIAVDLLAPKDKAAMNKLVADYIQKHVQIKADGKLQTVQFLGYEQQEEGIVGFFVVNNLATVKTLDITDNILYSYQKEQVSVLHVTVGGNRKSTKLNNPSESFVVSF